MAKAIRMWESRTEEIQYAERDDGKLFIRIARSPDLARWHEWIDASTPPPTYYRELPGPHKVRLPVGAKEEVR